jgi:hypothetical protein
MLLLDDGLRTLSRDNGRAGARPQGSTKVAANEGGSVDFEQVLKEVVWRLVTSQQPLSGSDYLVTRGYIPPSFGPGASKRAGKVERKHLRRRFPRQAIEAQAMVVTDQADHITHARLGQRMVGFAAVLALAGGLAGCMSRPLIITLSSPHAPGLRMRREEGPPRPRRGDRNSPTDP